MADFQHLFYKNFCPWVPFRHRWLISSICSTYNRTAFGGQMHTKRPLYLIARVQMKTDGEHIQDKRFLCLITRVQTKTYGEQIQGKRLLCLIARIRTKTCGEQIQDMCVLCLIARISYTTWHFLPLIQTESGHSIVLS